MNKEDLAFKLMAKFLEWQTVKEEGDNSPVWTDGQALNHIRDSIIRLKREMESLNYFPEVYYRETPDQMPQCYMVNADEIREKAKETLQICQEDENYQFIFSHGSELDEQQKSWICLDGTINSVLRMARMIRIGNLVEMKKYSELDKYLKSFKVCRKGLEELLEELEDLKLSEKPKEPEVIYEQIKLENI